MASVIIHIAIAKKVLNELKVDDRKDYYLGSIAPDISKHIKQPRYISHFITHIGQSSPDIDYFVSKYPNFKNNSFDLGYFTHLYTDKRWFDDFLPNIVQNCSLKLLDGTIVTFGEKELLEILYNDYTNLNISVIEDYDLDLSLFYEDFKIPNTKLKEIPVDKLNILLDQMGIVIENSKREQTYTMDMLDINNFIEDVSKEIIEILKEY